MNDDRLLSIGGFALLTGLSVTTLRHYDAEGVLPAAWVDPETTDRAALIAFYQAVFGARFSTEIGSFEFGSWPDDEFFLLTPADEETHPGASGPSRFGLLVADLDAAHARALAAGARELSPPVERPWKPRWSCVADPGGNVVDLYQS